MHFFFQVTQLSSVGGTNIRDNTNRVMGKLMSNALMSSMNAKGLGGKLAFTSTMLYKVVTGKYPLMDR